MKIAILSRSKHLYSTHSLFRAGLRQGHKIEVIDHTLCNLVVEKDAPKIFFEGRDLSDIEAIIPRIGASVTGYGAAVIEQFELMGVFTSVRTQALLQSRDKLKCLQKLSMAGIDIPKSFIVYNSLDLSEMLEILPPGPVIIKLLESTHGAGVIIAETHQSAMSIVEAFTKCGQKVLVQEYIKESDGADIRAFVVGGEVVAAMRRQAAEGEFRSNLHRGASSVAIKLTTEQEYIVKKAAWTMGLDVAGVDLLPSTRGHLVMEVNASPGLEGIEGTTGIGVGVAIMNYVVQQATNMANIIG